MRPAARPKSLSATGASRLSTRAWAPWNRKLRARWFPPWAWRNLYPRQALRACLQGPGRHGTGSCGRVGFRRGPGEIFIRDRRFALVYKGLGAMEPEAAGALVSAVGLAKSLSATGASRLSTR